jgi:hypothetical protein
MANVKGMTMVSEEHLMAQLLSFICAELNTPYEEVYAELASHLEMDLEATVKRFAPDDAVARVRYHRRQASRRSVQSQLAELLGIDAEPVFAACSEEGARILLDALGGAPAPHTLTITTSAAMPTVRLLDELEDAMAR